MATEKRRKSFVGSGFGLVKQTVVEFIQDRAPQLGAGLAYYTVFSLAPLILVLLAIVGVLFRNDPDGAWTRMTMQMSTFLDEDAMGVVRDIARQASEGNKGTLATVIGIGLALFGASGVFGQLQIALNTIWGVKPKPGNGIFRFLRRRFLSFAMVAGMIFLLIVSLFMSSALRAVSQYLQSALPAGTLITVLLYIVFDFAIMALVFAVIFKYLPDAKVSWRDVWIGAALTTVLFGIGKWALGLYLGSGSAASMYGAASSLITLLIWVYYSAQIMLFGAEFTQVYANQFGSQVEPDENAVNVDRFEVEESKEEEASRALRPAPAPMRERMMHYAETQDAIARAEAMEHPEERRERKIGFALSGATVLKGLAIGWVALRLRKRFRHPTG